MTENITFKGKVNKGIQNYYNIMTNDPAIAALNGKIVTLQVISVEDAPVKQKTQVK